MATDNRSGWWYISKSDSITDWKPHFVSSIPLHHSKFTRDIMGYFRPPKTALSTVENVVVYPLGYHHGALHDGFKCFPAFIFFPIIRM
jgi:hypothetical protein